MCGIVAGVAERNIVPVLLEGLRRLEYRGYDSCGVAVLRDGAPQRVRSLTRVRSLDREVREIGPRRRDGHRAHAMGDARRAGDPERASDLLEGRDRDRSQRHHRELRGAEEHVERARAMNSRARRTRKSSPT